MGPRPSTRASARSRPGGTTPSRLAARTVGSRITSPNSIICNTVDTSTEDTTASMKQKTITMALKVMRCEERNVFFGDLIRARLGTREVENFIYNQEYLRREEGAGGLREGDKHTILEREREMVGKAMENKLTDSLAEGVRKKQEFNILKDRLWWRLGSKKEEEKRRLMNRVRDEVGRQRRLIKKDHQKQIRQIRMDNKCKRKETSLPKELSRYKEAKVFSEEARLTFKPGEVMGPVTVGLEEGLLDQDEIAVLRRGPKFCCRRILSKERYLVEMEKCYCKIRWEERDRDPDERKKQKDESSEEKKERERVERLAEDEAIKSLLVFDQDSLELDYRKRRATACKNNTAVILPGPLTAAQEQEIECRRVEWIKVFDDFMEQFTDEEGVQESNLTSKEARGLKKLQKRV